MSDGALPQTEYDCLLPVFEGRPSTYSLIKSNINPLSSNLRDPYVELPWDAHPSYEFKGPEFTPEEDARLTAHNFTELSQELRTAKLEKALLDLVRQPTLQTLLLFCGRFHGSHPRQLTKTLQAHFKAEPGLSGRCARFALWLSLHAPETPLCQAGLDLLSVCAEGLSADELSFINKELLPLLGLHDDVSIQVGQLIVDLHLDPAELLYSLARKVTGWAKVHYVNHLSGSVKPHMRRWLLEEGSFNDVIREYLTLICVEEGRLIDVLRQPALTDADIVMAGDLLESLVEGIDGPAGSILDYDDALEAIELWLAHLPQVCANPIAVESLLCLSRFFANLQRGEYRIWTESDGGWAAEAHPERIAEMEQKAAVLVGSIDREGLARRTLALATDSAELHAGYMIARELGLDVWDALYTQVLAGRLDKLVLEPPNTPERLRLFAELAAENLRRVEALIATDIESGRVGYLYDRLRVRGDFLQIGGRLEDAEELLLAGLESEFSDFLFFALLEIQAHPTQALGQICEVVLFALRGKELNKENSELLKSIISRRRTPTRKFRKWDFWSKR